MIVTEADKIAAAKLWLVSTGRTNDCSSPRDQPYLAHALYALTTVPCTEVDTMSCDEHWRVYVNPSWAASASVREVGSTLAHLTWHLLFDHAGRGHSLAVDAGSAPAWHCACDCAVEPTLAEGWLTPDGFPSAADLGLPDGLSAEEYYATLSRLPVVGTNRSAPLEDGCGSGCDGLMRPYELPPGIDLGEVGPEDARQLRRLVSIAYREHITGRGLTPGEAWRWTIEVLEPTIRWESLLASMVRRAVAWTNGHTDYTYRRRSRRQGAVPNVVLPGTRRPVPNVAVVIDTSGSVDDGLLARALGEVTGTLRGLGVSDAAVTVIACDAAVHAIQRVRHVADVRLGGGGGTDLRAGIAAAAELRPRCDVVIVLTDGYTPWPKMPPASCRVIAALLARAGHPLPPTPAWVTPVECRL